MYAKSFMCACLLGLVACSQQEGSSSVTETRVPKSLAANKISQDPLPEQRSVSLGRKTKLQRRQVMVGGNSNLDACDSWATVTELNPQGDGYLSIRAWPQAGATELDRLTSRHPVLICEISTDGVWAGVVYPANHDGDLADCGLSFPKEGPRHVYNGSCKSGWAARRLLDLSAG